MIMFLLSLYFKVGKILINHHSYKIPWSYFWSKNYHTKILCHLAYDTLDPICMILFICRRVYKVARQKNFKYAFIDTRIKWSSCSRTSTHMRPKEMTSETDSICGTLRGCSLEVNNRRDLWWVRAARSPLWGSWRVWKSWREQPVKGKECLLQGQLINGEQEQIWKLHSRFGRSREELEESILGL